MQARVRGVRDRIKGLGNPSSCQLLHFAKNGYLKSITLLAIFRKWQCKIGFPQRNQLPQIGNCNSQKL